MNWDELTHIRRSDSDEWMAEGRVPPDSPWFSGHFPNEPILPGIAQLSMVFELIRRALAGKGDVRFKEIKRVRFKQIIRPDDPIRIVVGPVDPAKGAIPFRIEVNEDGLWPIACSGNAIAIISGRQS
jgi:3-hydroxymyristoyl/3-hydroxydecanoyl-(acyl carrier protein) dehydratase